MKNDTDKFGVVKAFSLLTQLGLNMACCVIIGVFGGKFLDGFFGTAPWCMLILAFVGAGASLKVLYSTVMGWNEKL